MCDQAVLIRASMILSSICWVGGILLALSIHRWIVSDERGLWPPVRRRLQAVAAKQLQQLGFPGKKASASPPSSNLSTPPKTSGDDLGNP